MAFAHLHTHSEYSLLDGANRIPDLVERVKALGMDSLAVTDHGNLFGAWRFHSEALKAGIRPILGFEAYVAFGSRHLREKPADAPGHYAHLVLLARDREGYRNLAKLTSIGYLEGYYRKPRVDREVLERHAGGLVCLSGCLTGEVALWLRAGAYEKAREAAEWHARTFGPGNFWLEIRDFDSPGVRSALARVPANRILAGTDWVTRVGPPFLPYGCIFGVERPEENPYPPGVETMVGFLKAAGAEDDAIELIGSGNAMALLRIGP